MYRHALAMRPLRRPRVWTAAQRAVCCGVSTLGGGRGRGAEKEGVSGPDGSEEEKWGEVVRTKEMRKPRMNARGEKKKTKQKCRKDERSKGKRQNRMWATKQEGDTAEGGKEA